MLWRCYAYGPSFVADVVIGWISTWLICCNKPLAVWWMSAWFVCSVSRTLMCLSTHQGSQVTCWRMWRSESEVRTWWALWPRTSPTSSLLNANLRRHQLKNPDQSVLGVFFLFLAGVWHFDRAWWLSGYGIGFVILWSHDFRSQLLCWHWTTFGKLWFIHVCLCHQAVQFGIGQIVVMLCGWEGNLAVILAMHYGLSDLSIYGLNCLRKGDELLAYALYGHGPVYFFASSCLFMAVQVVLEHFT